MHKCMADWRLANFCLKRFFGRNDCCRNEFGKNPVLTDSDRVMVPSDRFVRVVYFIVLTVKRFDKISELRGIDKQNPVGFLALLEHLCYCEVGSFLKSPSHPIWVLGSETHLSVLFSTEPRLVSPETPADQAKRVFRKFDPEGNNFISANSLQDVLAELGLVTDAD